MKLFFDESGNTGLDLLSQDQPVFSLAATNLRPEQCSSLISPLLKKGQPEAKYGRLKKSRDGKCALLEFFSSEKLNPQTAKFEVADKRFWLVSHLVDKLIEPTLHEAGIDLYAGDAHVGLANVWYYTGHTIYPDGLWDKILRSFLQAIRRRTKTAFAQLDTLLVDGWEVASGVSREFATGLFLAHGRLDEFLGVYKDVAVFDPAVDTFVSLVNKWMASDPGRIRITHDRSKPMRRSEAFLRTLMTPAATRIVGYGERQAELPLRVSELIFGDSREHPPVQVADLIAGASIDCLLAWSGLRPSSDYHDAMKETRLKDLFTGGVLPSPDIERRNEPQAGEKSIVDGQTDFLRETGYFIR